MEDGALRQSHLMNVIKGEASGVGARVCLLIWLAAIFVRKQNRSAMEICKRLTKTVRWLCGAVGKICINMTKLLLTNMR